MKKSKILLGMVMVTMAVLLVAGCGAEEKPAGHDMKNMQMPKEDPMPIMKDMEQQLQNLMKQVKSGQTMEAQKTANQLMSLTDKVMPHMMDNGLKDGLRQRAADIKDTVNAGKMDPSAIENKVKALEETMKQTTAHLQTMQH